MVVLFAAHAFDVALNLTSALALIPYFLTAGFGLRSAWADPRDGPRAASLTAVVVAALATGYTAFLLYAAGGEYVLLAMLILVPGTILFAIARRRAGARVFALQEWVLFALALAGGEVDAVRVGPPGGDLRAVVDEVAPVLLPAVLPLRRDGREEEGQARARARGRGCRCRRRRAGSCRWGRA